MIPWVSQVSRGLECGCFRRRFAAVLGCAAISWVSGVSAKPPDAPISSEALSFPLGESEPGRSRFWGRVNAPARVRAQALYEAMERSRGMRHRAVGTARLEQRLNERSAVLLSLEGVSTWGDAALMYLQGATWAASGDEHAAQGAALLEEALRRFPNSAFAARARYWLAERNAHLGEATSPGELFVAVDDTWEPESRAHLLFWSGLASLRQLELGAAEVALSEGRRLAEGSAIGTLCAYLLAATLDLAFRPSEADPLAFLAYRARYGEDARSSVLSLPEAGVLGPGERTYLRALGTLADAQRHSGESAEVGALQGAQLVWGAAYDELPSGSPWRERARSHVQAIKRKLERLLPRRLDDGDPNFIFRLEQEERRATSP